MDNTVDCDARDPSWNLYFYILPLKNICIHKIKFIMTESPQTSVTEPIQLNYCSENLQNSKSDEKYLIKITYCLVEWIGNFMYDTWFLHLGVEMFLWDIF